MQYRVVIYFAAVLAVFGVLFARLVPGATNLDGSFTDDYWLNTYFVLMGFVVTTAIVSPVVALFLDWRSDRAWRPARLNVRNRLAASLHELLDSYGAFLKVIGTRDERAWADTLLSEMRLALDHWFDTYESEQSAFSPQMHSAASKLRQQLLPFKNALETTNAIVHRKRSHRLYMGEHSLNTLRAAFEQPPVASGSKLDADVYFANHRELFLDVRLDAQLGAGVMRVHPIRMKCP